MKKMFACLTVALFCVSSVQAEQQKKSYYFGSECVEEFAKGFAAGFAGTVVVDFARNYILPSLDSLKLHDNYGVCRDRLEGEARVAVAALGLAAIDSTRSSSFKKTGAQLVGILVGAAAANYSSKLASNTKVMSQKAA